jgi:divalent metal cation (Fe/Co/Zn/Cd) transporter
MDSCDLQRQGRLPRSGHGGGGGGVSPAEIPVLTATPTQPTAAPDAAWLRTAQRARLLSWVSLAWMAVEGVVGLIAGLDANALSVVIWAASSFVEGLASMIVIWRFTGSRTMSESSERVAQRLVAGSFLLLVPFFVYEAIHRLVDGSHTTESALGIAVTASAIVLMPALGHAKLRLGEKLGSRATAGEGVQNLMCAAQATAALVALVGAGAGLSIVDPIAALVVAAIAATESLKLWRGASDDCCAPVGFGPPARDRCCGSECECC